MFLLVVALYFMLACLASWLVLFPAGRAYVLDQWWVAAAPGAAIFTVSLAFNLLGDGLRDRLDPKLSRRM